MYEMFLIIKKKYFNIQLFFLCGCLITTFYMINTQTNTICFSTVCYHFHSCYRGSVWDTHQSFRNVATYFKETDIYNMKII